MGRSLVVLMLAAGAVGVDTAERRAWPLVHVSDPLTAQATRNALEMASTMLARPECNAVLGEFNDERGRPLADRLAGLALDSSTYLTTIVFLDDMRHPTCARGALASTQAGARVVRVCTEVVKQTWRENPRYTAAAFIHEMLHTLGLGENPPSSNEITKRVLARCGRQRNHESISMSLPRHAKGKQEYAQRSSSISTSAPR